MHTIHTYRYAAFLLCFLLGLQQHALAASGWQLKKQEDGIRIYTKDVEGSNLKALKAELKINAAPAALAALLLNIDRQKEWVYSTRSAHVVKRISADELIYYSEKTMPWPVINRDAVVQLSIQRNAATGAVTAKAVCVKGIVPEKKDIVRVPLSTVKWVAIPDGSGMHITYEAQVDPGGTLPSWVVNLFSTKGALETFKKLRQVLETKAS